MNLPLLMTLGFEFWILHGLCSLAHCWFSLPRPWFLSPSSEDPNTDLQSLLSK